MPNSQNKVLLLQDYMLKEHGFALSSHQAESIINSLAHSATVTDVENWEGKEYVIQGFGNGATILINGKDITGNLGNITYGDKSPIINGSSNNISYSESSQNLQENNPISESAWYQRPIGILFLMIVGGLIIAAIVYRLGWNH
ncbi:MAG: hypothetical protein JWO50_20 [Candidatus Kaiserbacteria bacterium]|nr:hypothetical protein [Candidatus Kaiserbacteria bacterium]